jgi:lipopolysaccharide biosynthesis protein
MRDAEAGGTVSTAVRVVTHPGDLSRARACLFVSYAPEYALKPHVRFHLAALRNCGFEIIYLLVVDRILDLLVEKLPDSRVCGEQGWLRGFVVRANAGYDFGAWADAFRLFPTLWDAECVLLVNDSVFGPVGELGRIVTLALASPADVVGLTESLEQQAHLQSYFLLLKGGALTNRASRAFWANIQNRPEKQHAIHYEVSLVSAYQRFGLTAAALFPYEQGFSEKPRNPTHYQWRELLYRGLPYIKAELLRDNPLEIKIDGWRAEIGDPMLLTAIDIYLAHAERERNRALPLPRTRPRGFAGLLHKLIHKVIPRLIHRIRTAFAQPARTPASGIADLPKGKAR